MSRKNNRLIKRIVFGLMALAFIVVAVMLIIF